MSDANSEMSKLPGAELIPLSALMSLPSGFYDGRWIDGDSMAALVEECVRMAAPQAQPADALDAAPAAPAADALLEALESIVDDSDSFDYDGGPSEASMIKARAAIAAYRATPAVAHTQPADALLLHALELACDHIDMDSLRISHCKDAAAIDAAMAAAQEGGKQ